MSDDECDSPRPNAFANRKTLRSSIIKHGGRSKSPNAHKSVSFSSKSERPVANVSDCWQHMKNGAEFVKLRGSTRHFRRLFSLDSDLSHIRWTPTNKKPHKARIAISDIKEVRVGRNTHNANHLQAEVQDDGHYLTILYGNYETLELMCDSADDAHIWVTGLTALCTNKSECQPTTCAWANIRERWLENVFEQCANDGFITEETAIRKMRGINRRVPSLRIKNKIKEIESDDENRGRISKSDFVEIYKEIATRPEVYFLMVRYSNKDYMTCQDLRLFLETEQGMVGVTTETCESLIEQFEVAQEAKENKLMTVDGFTNFLLSSQCVVFDPLRAVVHQDMNQSFSHYFIATSHNTFLVEDQTGPAALEGYVSALKKNCRVIDALWDPPMSEASKDPVVQNGVHATSRLTLVSVLDTIVAHAFERSEYPLIVRLAVHCGIDEQRIAARLLTSKLSKLLYVPANDRTDWINNDPTPAAFMKRILIMGKTLPSCVMNGEGSISEEDEMSTARRKPKKISLCKELASLIASFLQSRTLVDLMSTAPNSRTMNSRQHVLNIAETSCHRLMQTYASEFSDTSKAYAIRVVPDTTRSDSGNVNPQEFWNTGVQMVALNYQTPGLMMDLQEGRFSENGGCGYVLKPSIMYEDYFSSGEKMPLAPQILHLRLLSAQHLPRPRGSNAKGDSSDPFVVIELFGVPIDCAEERTRTVRNDSHNPCFDETFQFQVSVPELALLRFLVLDDEYIGDDFIGQYTIPFECLQPGYRHIPLLNNEGDALENASLFVHIAVTNKRGGGKAKKRGMSVRKGRATTNSGLKTIGIRSVDDHFKAAVEPITQAIEMRTKLEAVMSAWQVECGLGAAGTIRQGLRLVHSRVSTLAANSSPPSTPSATTETPHFYVDSDEQKFPVIVVVGTLPDQLLKNFHALKALISHCVYVISKSDNLLAQMEMCIARITECHSQLAQLCADAALRGPKALRAVENFTWNLRLLKAQLSMMNKTGEEAQSVITQVFDTAGVLGVLSARHRRKSSRTHDSVHGV